MSKYATLMELNCDENESWYTFIKVEGNEEALKKLKDQLESVTWDIDDGSTFDLETEHPVSELTAKEMTKLDLNPTMFHRKFDGKLKEIAFGFRSGDNDLRKMKKVAKLLEGGGIENFIDAEDVDPEDIAFNESDLEDDDEKHTSTSSSEEEVETRRKYKKRVK